MSDIERRTQKLADALQRAGKSVAPNSEQKPARQAVPMNGPIQRSPEKSLPPAPRPETEIIPNMPLPGQDAASQKLEMPDPQVLVPLAEKSAAANVPPPLPPSPSAGQGNGRPRASFQHRTLPRPPEKKKSRGGLWAAMALLLALGGGAGWLVLSQQPEWLGGEGAQDGAETATPPVADPVTELAVSGDQAGENAPAEEEPAPVVDPVVDIDPTPEIEPRQSFADLFPEIAAEETPMPRNEPAAPAPSVVPDTPIAEIAPVEPVAPPALPPELPALPETMAQPEPALESRPAFELAAPAQALTPTITLDRLAPAPEGRQQQELLEIAQEPPRPASVFAEPTAYIVQDFEGLDLAEQIAQSVVITPPTLSDLLRAPTAITDRGFEDLAPNLGQATAAAPNVPEPQDQPSPVAPEETAPETPVASVSPEERPAELATLVDRQSNATPAPRVEPEIAQTVAPSDLVLAYPLVIAGTEPSIAEPVFSDPHRVIIHYNPLTPGALSEARRIQEDLRAAGAEKVEIATIRYPIDNTQARYYLDRDLALGDAVARIAGDDVSLRDFTSFSPAPLPGLIELWVASDAP